MVVLILWRHFSLVHIDDCLSLCGLRDFHLDLSRLPLGRRLLNLLRTVFSIQKLTGLVYSLILVHELLFLNLSHIVFQLLDFLHGLVLDLLDLRFELEVEGHVARIRGCLLRLLNLNVLRFNPPVD